MRNASVLLEKRHVHPSAFAGTDSYLRVNHKPHITIVDFFGPVKFDEAVANIRDSVLTVTVPKASAGQWAALEAAGTRVELNERRKSADERKEKFMKQVCGYFCTVAKLLITAK